MEERVYELMEKAQSQHWWYIGKMWIIKALIENHIPLSKKLQIADVGCGYGGNILLLQQYGNVTALETFNKAQQYIKAKWGNSVHVIDSAVPEAIPQRFDLIMMTDVLEHIPDHETALNWIFEHLNPGGHALITVPAHQWLWTEMDDLNHHVRRYNKKTLSALLSRNFKIIRMSYYNFFLLPAKFLHVITERLKRFVGSDSKVSQHFLYPVMPSKLVNEFLKSILYFEAQLFRLGISFPIGVNITLLAQKQS